MPSDANRSPNDGLAAALTRREIAEREPDARLSRGDVARQREDGTRAAWRRPRLLLFDRFGIAGNLERRSLAAYVYRSALDLPRPRPGQPDLRRAVYRITLAVAEGDRADLRGATRAAMHALESKYGPLAPWLAAEHVNSSHSRVHLVLPTRREVEPGYFLDFPLTVAKVNRLRCAFEEDLTRQLGARESFRGVVSVQRSDRPDVLEDPTPTREGDPRPLLAVTRHELAADLRQVGALVRNSCRELDL